MPKTKNNQLADTLEALINNYSMPNVVAELILYSKRQSENGWTPWERSLTRALSDVAGPEEVTELVVVKPA